MHNPTVTKATNTTKRVSPISTRQKIVFSEYPLWFAFSFAFFITISETIFGFPLRNALILKHIALLIFLPAFAMHIVGRTLVHAPRISSIGWFKWLWPFLLLGVFATLGSLYARFALDIRETFLVLGIYLLITPLFFIWGREIDNTNKVVKPFLFLWGISSSIAIVGTIFYFKKNAVLHNIEFLIQPFFLYLFFAQTKAAGKIIALMIIILVAILSHKLTGYINGIAAVSYIGLVSVNKNATPEWKNATRILSIALLISIIGVSTLSFFSFREYLPSGNTGVRLHQYENVFAEFLASPMWGQAYTSPSGETYIEYTRSLNIPTHSDILDLLKEGGVIALGLWLIGIFISVKLFIRCAVKKPGTSAFFHAMAFLTISTVLAVAVNPLFLTPTFAFIIWGSLALALGVATDTREGQFNAS